MKQQTLYCYGLFCALFLSLNPSLFSQQNFDVNLRNAQTRYALALSEGENGITLNGLEPGNTYSILVLPATNHVKANLDIVTNSNAQSTKGKEIFHFTATNDTESFRVKASSLQKESSIPVFVSVDCESCPLEIPDKTSSQAEFLANLEVQENFTAEQLIKNTLIGGDCFDISNVTFNGNPLAIGKFRSGGSNIGIDSGMVMSTGRINVLPGPNFSGAAYGGFGPQGNDPDLSSIVSGRLYDVNIIEFDFTPTANTVQFEFAFGSDEYCEYVGTVFNDVFGFFISGPGINGVQNLAVIPGTNGVPVTTNNVNHADNSSFYVNNNLELLECDFLPANHIFECELDGWTVPITALATVTPCETYHLKLAIADVEDKYYDSAVFLKANSFNSGDATIAAPEYANNEQTAYENCQQGGIRFSRLGTDLSQPITIDFTVLPSSTATAGVDYEPLVSPVTIPAGESEVLLPVIVFQDTFVEGQESIILQTSSSCNCDLEEIEFLINDAQVFTVTVVQDTTICEGSSVLLIAETTDGVAPFLYDWNTGDSTETLMVSPTQSSTYTVTVTDDCGMTATDEVRVDVIPILRDTSDVVLCAGGEFTLNGITYTSSTVVQDTTFTGSACGEITTYVIDFLDPVTGADSIGFCPGDEIIIAGNSYNSPGIVLDTLVDGQGCDSVVTHTLFFLPNPMRSETISFCPGDTVYVGGVPITDPGSAQVVIPASVGCDTIVTHTFEWLDQPTRSETIGICPGDSVLLAGIFYSQPGTVVVEEAAAVGCDTIVTYTVEFLTPAPSNMSMKCPNNISIDVATGVTSANITYNDASVSSDCLCPGIDLQQSAGLPSGSDFPLGTSQVCYSAQDACGQTASCCFDITVAEGNPCDVKTIGCMKYELLTITQDQFKNKTYKIRVTNFCSDELIYTAIQIPSGIIANKPLDNTIYVAPSGNQYLVRNPNYSPIYSVRYRALNGGIANGQSDVLRYTLPAQADVTYINVTSRINIQQYYSAHLNTFYCPIGITPVDERSDNSKAGLVLEAGAIAVFPNPTSGDLNIDLSMWEGQRVRLQMFSSQGQRVLSNELEASATPQKLDLPANLSTGLYFLEVSDEIGDKEILKVVVQK